MAEQAREVEQLRAIIIRMGRMMPGILLDDSVSSDFLAYVPDELAAHLSALATLPAMAAQGREKRLEEALRLLCDRADSVQEISGGTIQHSDLLVATIAARAALTGEK